MKDLFFILKLFRPYKLWFISGVFLALLTALASISLLTLSGWFITSTAIAGIAAPDGVAITFNFMVPAAQIRALAIIRTVSRYGERLLTHEATFRGIAEMRCWFFKKLIPLAPGRLAMRRSADLLTGITQDIDVLDSFYLRLCIPFLIVLMGGTAVVIFIASYSVPISLFVLLMLTVTALLIPWVFNRLGQKSVKENLQHTATFKIEQIELLQGLADLCIFNAYSRFKTKLILISEQMIETQRKNIHWAAFSSAIIGFLSHITFLISLVLAGSLFQQGEMSGAIVVMLSFCILAVFEWVAPVSLAVQMLAKIKASLKRIRNVTELTPLICEPQTDLKIPPFDDLTINKLSFRYSSQTDWVLKNIDLTIPKGSKIAIVGKSGAGKTTLLQLIMRFFDPQQGEISYSGLNYKKFQSDQLMEQFAVLSQRSQLFSATIKENLLIAKPLASELEIRMAVKMAGLDDWISRLPEGLNTWVGENGAKVSGGEARRIALARVYLKNAPILILDEPTEGLDKETENEVLDTLEKLAEQKTLILVTHRKSGLRLVDSIYRMTEGELVKM